MTPLEYTAVILIWISSIFGGQGAEASKDFPTPLPIRASLEFPTEKGCKDMLRALEKNGLRYKIVQDCLPKNLIPVKP